MYEKDGKMENYISDQLGLSFDRRSSISGGGRMMEKYESRDVVPVWVPGATGRVLLLSYNHNDDDGDEYEYGDGEEEEMVEHIHSYISQTIDELVDGGLLS